MSQNEPKRPIYKRVIMGIIIQVPYLGEESIKYGKSRVLFGQTF
jgi:hypothetical protein